MKSLQSSLPSPPGCKVLSEALAGNNSITRIYLQGNQITDVGLEATDCAAKGVFQTYWLMPALTGFQDYITYSRLSTQPNPLSRDLIIFQVCRYVYDPILLRAEWG